MNDLIPIIAASPLRQRLIDDMTMRRFSRETQRNYIRDVGRFATWLGRSPHIAMAEDLRRFQIEPQEADVPVPTMNSVVIRHGSFLIAPAATSLRGTEGPTSSMRKADSGLPKSNRLHLSNCIAGRKADGSLSKPSAYAQHRSACTEGQSRNPHSKPTVARGFGHRRLSDAYRRPKL